VSIEVRLSSAGEVTNRWPHIARFLELDDTGGVGYDFLSFCCVEKKLSPAKQAAANEEWADYFEYRLLTRAEELAGDRVKRHLVEEWTDSMVYLSRRRAAYARGEDPGPWVPQHVRRPDLDATGRAITEEIVAELDADDETDNQFVGVGR
jgi:hypothetical protein